MIFFKKKIKISIQDIQLRIEWFSLNTAQIFDWDSTCRNFGFFNFSPLHVIPFKNFKLTFASNDIKANGDLNLFKIFLFFRQFLNLKFSEKISAVIRSPISNSSKRIKINSGLKFAKTLDTSKNTFYFYPNLNLISKIKFIKFYFLVLLPYFYKRQIQVWSSFSRIQESIQFTLSDVPQLITTNYFYLPYDYFEWNSTVFFLVVKSLAKSPVNYITNNNMLMESDILKQLVFQYSSFLRLS
jgi:hypothetical protein